MMNNFTQVPPGFRFHPTDEELIDYYLRRKIASKSIDLDVIKDIDLYRIEPWDLQELCRIGTEEQIEWYFFSHKDKKYPTGTRTNRATTTGFWKATGRDKAIYKKNDLIGMRKTLVFYKGRAPNGQKSDWIMHEYRLETDENGAPQEEGWVVCRVFKKRMATMRKFNDHDSPNRYNDQVSFMPDMESPTPQHANLPYRYHYRFCMKEMDHLQYVVPPDQFLQLPHLESPKIIQARSSPTISYGPGLDVNPGSILQSSLENNIHETMLDQNLMMDWRVLDKFVASQLSHEKISKENDASFGPGMNGSVLAITGSNLIDASMSIMQEAATSNRFQVDMWK